VPPEQIAVAFWMTLAQLLPQLPQRVAVFVGASQPLPRFESQSPKPLEQAPE
jgi:mitochondrial fission protein ELM1